MDGWNTSFLLGWPIFRGYVSSGRVSDLKKHHSITVNFQMTQGTPAPWPTMSFQNLHAQDLTFETFERLRYDSLALAIFWKKTTPRR